MDSVKLKISKIKKIKANKFSGSELQINLEGPSINNSIVNALRRVIKSEVPVYAFARDKIVITKNTSIYNNDHMTLRLKHIPILNMAPDINIEKKTTRKIEIVSDYVNETGKDFAITTNDCLFLIDGKKVKNPYDREFPHLIIKLRPKQKFSFKATSVPGVANSDDIWSPVSSCYFEEKTKHSYLMTIESLGQMDEHILIQKACQIIIRKLDDILFLAEKKLKDKKKYINLLIDNEDHTVGNLLATALQVHKQISFAGYKMGHPLIYNVNVIIETDKISPIKAITDVVSYLTKIFRTIESQAKKF